MGRNYSLRRMRRNCDNRKMDRKVVVEGMERVVEGKVGVENDEVGVGGRKV